MVDSAMSSVSRSIIRITFIAIGGWCGAVLAQPVPLADQTNAMEAQIQILRKRAELNQALAQAATPGLGPLPRVLAIYGLDQALVARLLLPAGVVASYREGDVIRAGVKLVAITSRSVVVAAGPDRQRRNVTLDFVPGARVSSQAFAGSGPSLSPAPGTALLPVPPEWLPAPPAVNVGRVAVPGQ